MKQFLINDNDLNGLYNYIMELPFKVAQPLLSAMQKVCLPYEQPKPCDCDNKKVGKKEDDKVTKA